MYYTRQHIDNFTTQNLYCFKVQTLLSEKITFNAEIPVISVIAQFDKGPLIAIQKFACNC